VREIPRAPELAHVLKAWKLACPITDLKLVFPSDRRKPVSGKLIDKYVFHPARAAAGFDRPAAKDINFHGLRHTFATTLLGDGVAPFIVSRLVGHASVAFTMARYGALDARPPRYGARRSDRDVRRRSAANRKWNNCGTRADGEKWRGA
jgi:integrase